MTLDISVSYFQVRVIQYSVWQPDVLQCSGLLTDFFNPVYLGSNVVVEKCPFLDIFRPYVLSMVCHFGQMSFGHMFNRPNAFQSYVFSVVYLSVIYPFGHLSLGHLS